MSTPKQLGDDLLREKGGVGEGRAARPSERPGVGGGARPDWRSVLEAGRHRQEGAVGTHPAGPRHPAPAGGAHAQQDSGTRRRQVGWP
jgi:hypothetical protein